MTAAEPWHQRFVVYRVFGERRCLYVGQSAHFEQRMETHQVESWWWRDVSRIKVTLHPTRFDAKRIEAQEIGRLRPRGNLYGRGPRVAWTVQDYQDVIDTLRSREPSQEVTERIGRNLREVWRRWPEAEIA